MHGNRIVRWRRGTPVTVSHYVARRRVSAQPSTRKNWQTTSTGRPFEQLTCQKLTRFCKCRFGFGLGNIQKKPRRFPLRGSGGGLPFWQHSSSCDVTHPGKVTRNPGAGHLTMLPRSTTRPVHDPPRSVKPGHRPAPKSTLQPELRQLPGGGRCPAGLASPASSVCPLGRLTTPQRKASSAWAGSRGSVVAWRCVCVRRRDRAESSRGGSPEHGSQAPLQCLPATGTPQPNPDGRRALNPRGRYRAVAPSRRHAVTLNRSTVSIWPALWPFASVPAVEFWAGGLGP